jgi:hypothetical protein
MRPGKPALLMLLGTSLWAIGVLGIHACAPLGVLAPAWSLPLLFAALPMAWLTLRLLRRVAGDAGLVEALAIASAPALLLDGVALTWAPWVYGAAVAEQRAAGAWLLWFVGVSLVLAMIAPAGPRVQRG